MRLNAIKFRGYAVGQTYFAPVFNSAPEVEREQIPSVIEKIADAITDPDNGQFTFIIIIGHTDRHDRSDMNYDQRRASEIAAERDLAIGA